MGNFVIRGTFPDFKRMEGIPRTGPGQRAPYQCRPVRRRRRLQRLLDFQQDRRILLLEIDESGGDQTTAHHTGIFGVQQPTR